MYAQNSYHQNLGTAGHRATSSFNYLPQYGTYPLHQTAPAPAPAPANQARSFYSAYPPYQNTQIPPMMPGPAPSQVPAPAPNGDQMVNGGINPVLEYDLNNMSNFLSWCAFGMLKQQKTPTKEFENLIVSVLFATRLPKSTVIIALEYMNQRFSKKEASPRDLSEQEIFMYLVVALILANKFNDDNTFTNKSWCGATGLELHLLNEYEKCWLAECKWSLNVVNFESNILTLEKCWNTWLSKYGNHDQIDTHIDGTSNSVSPVLHSSPSYPVSSPAYYDSNPRSRSYYSSIPSSPLYSNDEYYYPKSSPVMSSPITYEPYAMGPVPVWPTPQHHQQAHPHAQNIWSHTSPSYSQNFGIDPAAHYGQHLPQQHYQSVAHHHPSVMYTHPHNNFVRFNPYYNYNMATTC